MSRIKFIPRIFGYRTENTNFFEIEKREYTYLSVTRIKNDDKIEIFDLNSNIIYNGIIEKISKTQISIKNLTTTNTKQNGINLDLAFSVCYRDNTRDIIDFATQLGITNFYPFKSKYSHKNGITFLEKKGNDIIIEATRQCRRNNLPIINNIKSITDIPKIYSNYENIILADPYEKLIDSSKLKNGKTLILIGPESGFDETDIEQLECGKIIKASFLGNVMRSQVAAISILSQAGILLKK